MTDKKGKPKKKDNGKNLVIVESPAKSRTINKILGSDYEVAASMGHLIDLPGSKMGIDFEKDFKPEYIVMKGRKKQLSTLKKMAKNAKGVFLAADPDREGEAICWHIKNEIEGVNDNIYRVSFEEITQQAVKTAFEFPKKLDLDKVEAQQARRILDRIVGYSISPLLWKKITRGLSAGRVQSVAVRLICDREQKRRDFKTKEYWSLESVLKKLQENASDNKQLTAFKAKLIKHKGKKIDLTDKNAADQAVDEIRKRDFIVDDVSTRNRSGHPRSPYITSRLQQDAFNKLNFSADRTMRIAQGLYEGVQLGDLGSVGLITYMRTDSVRISDQAYEAAEEYIKSKYGQKFLPKKRRKYRSRKGAQEAHEAIRPTLPLRSPEEVEKYLKEPELKLYKLIWKRFISSQMASALWSVYTVKIAAGEYLFRTGGSDLVFEGFLKPYIGEEDKNEKEYLPPLSCGERLELKELLPEQHFTKPPARYTDASLVRVLEEKGIGRPSTYAPIIRTVIKRNYVKRSGKSLMPTDLGELVNKVLLENFPSVVDEEFTAKVESQLDRIEQGDVDKVAVLREFYGPFQKTMEKAKQNMQRVNREVIHADKDCPKCGKPMVIKWGRRGRFLSCSDFPACKYSESITTGIKCPEDDCDGELVERRSRRGVFYGCTKYPECTHITQNLPDGNSSEEATGKA